jgi:acyl carrier protein
VKALETERLREIVELALDRELETFTLDDRLFEELGMDSMGAALMIVEIEKETGVRIADDQAERLRTGHDVMALIGGA